MAIAFDASASTSSTAASMSFNHTCTGSNLILFVTLTVDSGSPSVIASGMTYNGVSMTKLDTVNDNPGGVSTEMWYLVGPSTGTHAIAFTANFGGSVATTSAYSASYTGARQYMQPDSHNSTDVNSTSISVALTTVSDNCWTVGCLYGPLAGQVITLGANTSVRVGSSVGGLFDSNGALTPAGSFPMSKSWTPTPGRVVGVAASFAPVPTTTTKTQTGVAKISITRKTQTGKADIKATATKTQTGVARIKAINSPDLTFRSITSPYNIVSKLTYAQTKEDGGDVFPVLQDEVSDYVSFRVYNNYAKNGSVADAINVQITTYDGLLVGSHTAFKDIVSRAWMQIRESGFGSNSTPPGLYTRYNGIDTAIGGTSKYSPERGSDGSTSPSIRAGTDSQGVGFVEVRTYIRVPYNAAEGLTTFALVVEYEF